MTQGTWVHVLHPIFVSIQIHLVNVRERLWSRLNIEKANTSSFILQVSVDFFNIYPRPP